MQTYVNVYTFFADDYANEHDIYAVFQPYFQTLYRSAWAAREIEIPMPVNDTVYHHLVNAFTEAKVELVDGDRYDLDPWEEKLNIDSFNDLVYKCLRANILKPRVAQSLYIREDNTSSNGGTQSDNDEEQSGSDPDDMNLASDDDNSDYDHAS